MLLMWVWCYFQSTFFCVDIGKLCYWCRKPAICNFLQMFATEISLLTDASASLCKAKPRYRTAVIAQVSNINFSLNALSLWGGENRKLSWWQDVQVMHMSESSFLEDQLLFMVLFYQPFTRVYLECNNVLFILLHFLFIYYN